MSLNTHMHWRVRFQSLLYHQIGGARDIFDALFKTHCRTLSDESLKEFIAEAEGIIITTSDVILPLPAFTFL